MFEFAILFTFIWLTAWVIFKKKYKWNLEIEQSPNLNGKMIFRDPVPNEGVRTRIPRTKILFRVTGRGYIGKPSDSSELEQPNLPL